jgi:hypothetical protein
MGYVLKDIVNEFLIETGQGQSNQFARFYQMGVSFLRRTNFNTTGFPKTKELIINANDTADLPNDYVRYTRIALCINGRLYCLGLDNTLCLNKSYNACGVPISHGANQNINSTQNLGLSPGGAFVGGPLIADNFVNGEFVGRMFGVGADNNVYGYYRIDENSNQIHFANLSNASSFITSTNNTNGVNPALFTPTLILEYLSDINTTDDDDFVVHPYAIEALKDWIQWKYKQRSSKPLGEQQMAKQDFNESNRLMRLMLNSSTKEEWVAAFASGNMAAPKM